ncbi:unannotated protein [freshwater metagenome]|uniref:Unannotated protein n=1 Tax=freshwater metagenome TaxID=449393 RepID=A0A6J6YGV2_9ZZZZ|nr:hypothetical protein [Actinomycetota bacterium]MSY07172.1 hypothetical protein [Actinomycetota bacterium]MSZ29673.1 hypothetical protein [Actinomycetota bacterium]
MKQNHLIQRVAAFTATALIASSTLGAAALPAGAASTPKPGGSIVYAISGKTTQFCIPRAQMGVSGIMVTQSMYDTLTVPNDKGKFIPYLAKSVTPNATFDKWTIGLRSGAKFHDGTPIDAASIKQNIDAWRKGLLLQFTFSPVSEVTVTDPLTVVVSIKQPWAAFPAYLFSAGRTGIVAPAQLNDTKNCETNLIGSGPFKLDRFDPSTGDVVVKRNPNYWRKGYPLLNKITFKVQGNSIQRLNGLQGGQFDVIHIPSGKSGKTAKTFANVNVVQSAKGYRDINNVLFNTQRPPFDDPTAREALARGIDRNILNVLANQGLGDVANQVVDSKVMGASKNSGFPKFDIKKAKQLVASYKAKHGGEFKFDLQTTFDTGVQDVAAEIKRQARKLGITVNLPSPIDEAQIVNSALAGKTDAFLWRNYPGSDPDTLYVWFHSGSIVNFGHINDPVIDTALEQGRIETDPAKRTAIYTKLFKHMSSTTPALWFGYSDWYIASKSNIKGIIGPNLPDANGKPGKEKPSQVVAGFHQLLGISKG